MNAPPRDPPASRRGAQTRDKLRKAAYQLFRDSGYEAATVDAICELAAVSKGAFYFHYTAKQDVFLDILETWTREIIDQVLTQFTSAVRSPDSIAAMTEAVAREVHRGRVLVPLWLDFTVQARRDPQIREALAQFYQRGRSAVAEILRPAVPWLDATGLQGLATTVFGAYMGVLVQEIADPDRVDATAAVNEFMAFLRALVREETR